VKRYVGASAAYINRIELDATRLTDKIEYSLLADELMRTKQAMLEKHELPRLTIG
jgi:hypothetical protein